MELKKQIVLIALGLNAIITNAQKDIPFYNRVYFYGGFTFDGSSTITSVQPAIPNLADTAKYLHKFPAQTQRFFYAAPNALSGIPSFRAIVASDIPTLNQNTTGTAASWTTVRLLAGNSVDGSTNVAFSNKFIVQGTSDAGLSGAQFLGSLGTGLVKNTTTTGILSIATSGTDYAPGTSGLTTGLLKSTTTTGALSIAVSGTDIKTVESTTLLGSGNVDITATMVGLGSVNNTSDMNKPVSTAQQAAINLKENDLGTPAGNNYVLTSLTDKTRSFKQITYTPQWDRITWDSSNIGSFLMKHSTTQVTLNTDFAYHLSHAVGNANDVSSYSIGGTQNIYYKVDPSGLSWREAEYITAVGDSITITVAGDYNFWVSLGASTSNTNDKIRVKVYINGAAFSPPLTTWYILSNGSTTTIETKQHMFYLNTLNVGDKISVRVSNISGARAISVTDFGMIIEKVAEL